MGCKELGLTRDGYCVFQPTLPYVCVCVSYKHFFFNIHINRVSVQSSFDGVRLVCKIACKPREAWRSCTDSDGLHGGRTVQRCQMCKEEGSSRKNFPELIISFFD